MFDKITGAIDAVIGAIGRIKFPKLPSWLPGDFMQKSGPAPAGIRRRFAAPGVATMSAAGRTGTSAPIVVNVTGALDPDAVARQIQRILGGRSRRVGGVNRTAGVL